MESNGVAPHQVPVPSGFSIVTSKQGIDVSEFQDRDDKELWLFRCPKSIDLSALDGQKLRLRTTDTGAMSGRLKLLGGEIAISEGSRDEGDGVVNMFPSGQELNPGKPFARVFSVTQAPAVEGQLGGFYQTVSAPAQIPDSELGVKFVPFGASGDAPDVTKQNRTEPKPKKKRKSTGPSPEASVQDGDRKKVKKEERRASGEKKKKKKHQQE